MSAEHQQQNGEQIRNIEELNVGDEVITSKGDSMDKRPLEVREIEEHDGTLTATIQGRWKNARKYDLVDSELTGIAMPDVGIITVERVATAGPEEATEEHTRKTVKVCHQEARITDANQHSYTAEMELGGVVQHVVLSAEYVHERVGN